MLSFVPQPVKAVLLLFPARGKLQEVRIKDDGQEENRFKGDVWYIKQQVGHYSSTLFPQSHPLLARQLTADPERLRLHRPPARTPKPSRG